jgi:hypothetical protein
MFVETNIPLHPFPGAGCLGNISAHACGDFQRAFLSGFTDGGSSRFESWHFLGEVATFLSSSLNTLLGDFDTSGFTLILKTTGLASHLQAPFDQLLEIETKSSLGQQRAGDGSEIEFDSFPHQGPLHALSESNALLHEEALCFRHHLLGKIFEVHTETSSGFETSHLVSMDCCQSEQKKDKCGFHL